MLTAKRAFNFMMDNGEEDDSQLLDVARFSPTARGQGGLLAQVGFRNAGGQQNPGDMPGSPSDNTSGATRQASASDAWGGTDRLGQDVWSPSEGGLLGRTPASEVKDFGTLERRRQREREGASSQDDDNPMRRAFAVPDPDSDEVRGRDYRFLTDNEKNRIRERLKDTQFAGMDLEPIKVHVGRVPWYLPSDMGAITQENHIMIGKDTFAPEANPKDFDILLEEVIHSGQYQSGMTRAGYLWDAARHGGYKNSYEDEAKGIVDNNKQQSQKIVNEGTLTE